MRCLRLALLLAAAALALPTATAQDAPDEIVLATGERFEAIVVEVLPASIRYRRWSNPTGPVYTVPIEEVQVVLYANGETDVFTRAAQTEAPRPAPRPTPAAPPPAASTATGTPSAVAPVAAAPADTQPFGVSSGSIGITATGVGDAALVGFGFAVSRARPVAQKVRLGYGYDLLVQILSASDLGGQVAGAAGIGLHGYVDYAISDRLTAYGAAGPVYVTAFAGTDGEPFATTTSTLTGQGLAGIRYRLGGKFGVHAQVHSNVGPAQFTIGFNRQGPFTSWVTGS